MDEKKKKEAISILENIFCFAHDSKILVSNDVIQAVLLGINCDLRHVNRGLIFSGHIDTVPVRDRYSYDKTCFYGRGTSDMKGFFPCLKRAFETIDLNSIKIPLIVVVTFDEEINNKGVSAIKDYLLINRLTPKYCIVGEPTLSSCALSNYGCYDMVITIEGTEGHISNENSHNCFDALLKSWFFLDSIKKKYGQTTIKITLVQGGEELNVSPAECKLGFQIRTMDYQNVLSICDELKTTPHWNGEFMVLESCDTNLPPFQNFDSYLAKIVRKHNGARNFVFPATTEAGCFQDIGIDTVICGPGDIGLAHTSYECIHYSDMNYYTMLLIKIIHELNKEYNN